MKNKLLIFYILLSHLLPQIILPAEKVIKREHISLEEGVSNNLIYSIFQDSKGIVWFGTMFGLVRYDGIEYKTIRNDPKDTNSLSNDDVVSIYESRDGILWIGTYNGGLNAYDRVTEKFKRFINDENYENSICNNTIWTIFQDSKGVMWFGTEEGLSKYDKGKFKTYKKDSSQTGQISGNNITSITEDSNGTIWIGTNREGLNKFDREKEYFTAYKNNPLDKNSLSGNYISSIIPDKNNILWIGTGRGLNKLNTVTLENKIYSSDSVSKNSLSNNYILSMQSDGNEILLIGTQNGLNKFDKSSGESELIKLYPERQNSRESILRFIKDMSGVIWISTYLEGLHKIYEIPGNFKSYLPKNNVTSIWKTNDGFYYVSTTNGLEVLDKEGSNVKSYFADKNNPNSLSSNYINSVTGDNESNLWIGTANGLNKLNLKSNKFTNYFSKTGDNYSLSSNNILKVFIDKEGILWAGTENGLNRFHKDSESFIQYKNIPGDKSSLSDNNILSIYEDKDGILYAGTYKGLNKFEKYTGKFKNYVKDPSDGKTISNNYVFSFCEDSRGNFWIGTGGGLNIFDKAKETFFSFTEKDGLPNSVITGITEDYEGNIWISTLKGISKFNLKDRHFRNFNTSDGLQSNMFNTGSFLKTESGEILFGGINGLNKITPGDFIEEEDTFPVIISNLDYYNGKDRIRKDITGLNETELYYNQNVFNINFASSDFRNPDKKNYIYKLDGFDKNWIVSGNSNEAVYTNLNPGEYIFRVKTINPSGNENQTESSFTIVIKPPFWKTWWFYLICVFVLISAIVIIQNYRVRKRVRDLLEIEKIKERERELMREQASRDYHDELGHKLTRISLYSRRINRKLKTETEGLARDLNSIVEASNSLQVGAKDLIWALNPQEDTLYDFAIRLKDFGNELFEFTGIAFSAYGINEDFRKITLSVNSKRNLIYIFKEGMNNILKYADCTKVDLSFHLYDEDLEILLEDNGVGFDVNKCSKGYGLKNIFARSKQININVNILSEEKSGTKITLKTKTSNLLVTS